MLCPNLGTGKEIFPYEILLRESYIPEPSTDSLGSMGEILSLRCCWSNPQSEREMKDLNNQGHLQDRTGQTGKGLRD